VFRILLEELNIATKLLRKTGETFQEPFLVTYLRKIY